MIALALLLQVAGGPPPRYRDATLPVETRVQDLLARMTPEEKFWQLYMSPGDPDDPAQDWSHGAYGVQMAAHAGFPSAADQARQANDLQRHLLEGSRLGIPAIPFEEAVHGLVRPDATAFPQAIALAATFDTALMSAVAGAIADETRSRGVRQVLSPVVNLASDVRWGRTEETYGEDPWLAARMATAFVRPFERAGVVTTPKHFVANVGEGGRDSYPVDATARELEERYFPPFAAAIAEGGARSVMTAYNSVNALPATQNPWLLTQVLRREWHFTGVTISDAAATGGPTVLQLTEPDTPHAAEHAWEAGLDVVFQSEWGQHRRYWEAVRTGLVAPAVIDSAVAHVLRLKFALGLFDHPYADHDSAEHAAHDPTHRLLARRA
ncbi:MAG TPA: glycoside hydrolase family 3 N-terminal domain-containing protein, partial [Gemmatimonadales bacterium]|nr:glycoside hydrolase family 3 N-terminal domain-containing protein [Gemmatimonadales bacterium]